LVDPGIIFINAPGGSSFVQSRSPDGLTAGHDIDERLSRSDFRCFQSRFPILRRQFGVLAVANDRGAKTYNDRFTGFWKDDDFPADGRNDSGLYFDKNRIDSFFSCAREIKAIGDSVDAFDGCRRNRDADVYPPAVLFRVITDFIGDKAAQKAVSHLLDRFRLRHQLGSDIFFWSINGNQRFSKRFSLSRQVAHQTL